MADVFVSYAREDKARADQIAAGLQQAGFDVFWDSEIPPGQTWADYIEAKLAQCKTLIVLWSETSTRSQWVREEARMARDRGKLIPVMLDGAQAPFGFGEVQSANLTTWAGEADHSDWRRLIAAVRDAVARPASTPPPPQPAAAAQPAQPAYAAHAAGGDGAASLSPWGYVQKCLRMYFNGHGRARRAEYWWFALFQFGALVAALVVDAIWNAAVGAFEAMPLFTVLTLLGLIGPAISVSIRRVHDLGITGWIVLVLLIPYLGALIMLVLALIPGAAGPNQYGPSPKAA